MRVDLGADDLEGAETGTQEVLLGGCVKVVIPGVGTDGSGHTLRYVLGHLQ